jgi:MOB kinase activator 1
VQEDFGNYTELGQGFPQGFEYRISGEKGSAPIRCTGPQYIEHVMSWAEAQLDVMADVPSGPTFLADVKNVFKRLFRVYAILYHTHFNFVKELGASEHLNTCFKHFIYFSFQFDLIPSKEMVALDELTKMMHASFTKAGGFDVTAN